MIGHDGLLLVPFNPRINCPQTWAAWVFEDYKFLATHKKSGKT